MSTIGVLGDLHGNTSWAFYALDWARRNNINTVLQAGDFGLYGNQTWGRTFLDKVSGCAGKFGIKLYVSDGNHEDHDYINSVPIEKDGWRHVRKNILVAPRPHRWEWEGVSFLSLGGAPSVDRTWQQRNKSWYFDEAITKEQAEAAKAGGRVDVMIGHDAPFAEGIESKIADNPHGFLKADLDYAYEGRVIMDDVFMHVRPQIMFAGHYHFPVDEFIATGPSSRFELADGTVLQTSDILSSRLIVLNRDQTDLSIAKLDLSTMQVDVPELFEDYNRYRFGKLGRS
jgi:hypothetical protein